MTTPASSRLDRGWVRLCIGVAILAGFFAFLAAGPRPPGMAGEIIDNNLSQDIQATALFYMDLDRMPEIEESLGACSEDPASRLVP